MATIEDVARISEERRQAEIKFPLLKLSLGDLVFEMHRLYSLDPNVIKPIEEISESSKDNYRKYIAIKDELNRREKMYNSHKLPVVYKMNLD